MNTDMKKTLRQVLVKFPSFGHTLANMDVCANSQIETAGTDGDTMYYNPYFLEGLTEKQRIFLISHEICHIELRHIARSLGKNPTLWNIASDAVINAYLKQAGLEMIEGGVDIPEALNMRAEDLYQKLLDEAKQKEKQSKNQEQQGKKTSEEDGQSFSDEDEQYFSDEDEQNFSDDNGQSFSNEDEPNDKNEEEIDADDDSITEEQESKMTEKYGVGHVAHDDWQEKAKQMQEASGQPLEKIDEKDVFAKNQEEKKKRQEQLRKQMVQESIKGVGQETMSSSFEISDVEEHEAIIDWKKLLKASLAGNQYDYRLAKRVRNGVIPYELKKLPEPTTEILLDTSGSISDTLLRNFLNECMSLVNTSRVKVGCFDTQFYGFHEINSKKDIQRMRFEGRGGTDFEVAVNAFSPSCENKLIFTDGCADTPQKRCKATWVIFEEDSSYHDYITQLNPPGGTKVFIPYDQYQKLAAPSYGNNDYDDYDDYDY